MKRVWPAAVTRPPNEPRLSPTAKSLPHDTRQTSSSRCAAGAFSDDQHGRRPRSQRIVRSQRDLGAASCLLVAAPAMLLAGGAVLTVVSVQTSATGTVWVLERASDGAHATLQFAGTAAGASLAASGAAVVATAVATGWLISTAGQAIAFVPNQIGASLLYNERVTR